MLVKACSMNEAKDLLLQKKGHALAEMAFITEKN